MDFVKCFWTLEAPAVNVPERQRIVPDGCMEMIIHYGDCFLQFHDDGTAITQPRSFVFGQITQTLEIAPTGVTGMIAARFHPDGFIPFTTMPVNDLDDRAVSLQELYGTPGDELEQEVLLSSTTEERIARLESFLLNRLVLAEGIDALVRSSVDLLLQSSGQLPVDLLAEQLQASRRQLERHFATAIGLSPKQLSKIIRLQVTLRMMQQKQFPSLTVLAHAGGYFDQAHFIKDFKEFTGVSPKQFYAGNLKMSALFTGTEYGAVAFLQFLLFNFSQLCSIIQSYHRPMKKLSGILLLFLSQVCIPAYSQKADALKWLPGTWKIVSAKGTVIETWKQVNDSTLTGKSVFVKAAHDTTLQETLELSFRKGQWSYISTVQGQNNNQPVAFTVIFLKGTEFIAENPAHDFPQRIAYRRIKDQLFASIEGKLNEKFSKRNFDFSNE